MTGYPNIDLFATSLNNRLPTYVSPIPDNRALAMDALSMNWDRIHGYAFPPFHIIPAILNKIHQFQCRIVLVAPLWPQSSWFPDLLQLLVAPPISLPNGSTKWETSASKSSNACSSRLGIIKHSITDKKFLKDVADHGPAARQQVLQERFMVQNGWSLLIGVVQERLILSRPLLDL